MPVTYLEPSPIVCIKYRDLISLTDKALKSPLKRSRICLHSNEADPVQEMIIAFCKNSYVRPHRYIDKTESFHVVEGKGIVFFLMMMEMFLNIFILENSNDSKAFVYRLSKPFWHTVIAITEFLILHEVTSGPFVKVESSYAPWAPDEQYYHESQLYVSRPF